MQRFVRRKNQPGRKPARWTFLEIGMLGLAILMIVFPLYAEAYRWVNPAAAPAASRMQENTADPNAGQPAARATFTPDTTSAPPATATTDPNVTPAATATTAPSATAINTAIPGTPSATLTPIPNDAPLRLFKSSSASSIGVGQEYNYTLSVFSNSTTPSTVDVRDTIDSQLDVVGATASKGTCTISGNQVTCSVTVQNNQPVTINIVVRVRSGASLGGRIANRALAQDSRQFTAASDNVLVDVSSSAPTSTNPTSTNPTSTNPTSTNPSATAIPGAPTNTPQPGAPTNTPQPGSTSNPNPKPTSKSNPTSDSQPTPPLVPPLPPTPRPGTGPRAPTPRPGTAPRPTNGTGQPRSSATAAAQATGQAVTQATAAAQAATPTEVGTFFRMASDWGSAFTGQEVNYVIAFRNTRASGALNNLVLSSALPANLQIIDQKADRGDPQIQGNQITFKLAALQAGEGVEIAIRAKIKDDVEVGTRIISQAEATYDGLALPLRSNIVTVLIVGSALAPAQAATQTLAPSAVASATPASPTPTAALAVAAAATAAPSATAAAAGGAAPTAPQLPATSTGVPISGFALLGLTMLLRTVRLHRGKSRI